MNETQDTSGFYRVDSYGDFQCAPNFVYAPDYMLSREEKDNYIYPTQGDWRWFETIDQACAFFELPPPETV